MKSLLGVLLLGFALSCGNSGGGRRNTGPPQPPPPPPDPYGRVMVTGAQVWEQLSSFVRHEFDTPNNLSGILFEQNAPAGFEILLIWPGDRNPGSISKWDGAELWVWVDFYQEWFFTTTNNPDTYVTISVSKWGCCAGDRTIGTFSGLVEDSTGLIRYVLYDGEFIAAR